MHSFMFHLFPENWECSVNKGAILMQKKPLEIFFLSNKKKKKVQSYSLWWLGEHPAGCGVAPAHIRCELCGSGLESQVFLCSRGQAAACACPAGQVSLHSPFICRPRICGHSPHPKACGVVAATVFQQQRLTLCCTVFSQVLFHPRHTPGEAGKTKAVMLIAQMEKLRLQEL